ncbi:MAG TPA: CoA pyrophosphatase [Chryseolinea sp.]|nr:CoA pyrophosphatase [Chryseolinea sp.]HPH47674.1 CoA pyrophosphatase [Chryseolinea sp.]HPM29602.1 CoA pyrophosphatase [Chryseolinea sp.]
MSLEELKSKLSTRLKQALPGGIAHELMRAQSIGNIIPNFEHKLPPKPGSVLILLYEEDGIIKFPLTKRQEYAGAHSGQISFPGGKAEPDEDVIQTALREAHEEIGADLNTVEVLGRLSDFFVIPSNFLVVPIVAITSQKVFVPDPFEVARILSGNIFDLIHNEAIKQKEILAAGKYAMMAPHFEIEGEVVWGATAMMLNEFRLILKEVL